MGRRGLLASGNLQHLPLGAFSSATGPLFNLFHLVFPPATPCLGPPAVVEEPPLHVVHVAVEMAPICKVGGLGDVVTALGRAVQEQGHMVEVILPRWVGGWVRGLAGATAFLLDFHSCGSGCAVASRATGSCTGIGGPALSARWCTPGTP